MRLSLVLHHCLVLNVNAQISLLKATRSLGAQIAGHWILLENIWEYYAVPATLKFKVNVNSHVACQSILRQAEHHNILLDLSTVFKVNLAF